MENVNVKTPTNVANIRLEIVALLWSGLGHIHILAMGCGAAKIRGYWER